MTSRFVKIDCFVDGFEPRHDGFAVVAVDVIRATSTAITAVATGRACYPAASLADATLLAAKLKNPLLAGELGGNMPYGFHLNNSPAALAARADISRPVVLLSSSGTRLMCCADGAPAVYAACFRNFTATARYVALYHSKVALLGAATRGEFREEDQICCAWIARALVAQGYIPEDAQTIAILDRWGEVPPSHCMVSKSVNYLRNTGQLDDLEFILTHVDDLNSAFMLKNGEIVEERRFPRLAVA